VQAAVRFSFSAKKITVKIEASPEDGISEQQIEETLLALRELGLEEDVEIG
jgi:hypothetical protein